MAHCYATLCRLMSLPIIHVVNALLIIIAPLRKQWNLITSVDRDYD